jgi:hypothetical protein
MPTITINPDLQSLIPRLTAEEFAQLEANLLQDGCHDPLIVWQEEQTLLDGHNRHDICERHGLDYRTQELSLPDLDTAKAWIIANQLGRRNLTPEQISYFRGKQYEMQKQQGKRTDLTSGNSYQKSPNTAAQLASQHKVAEKTIRNDAAYAQAVDAIAELAGPEARQVLLARETKITQQEVKQLADVAKVSPPTVQEVMASVQVAKTPKTVKQIVQLTVEAAQKQVATVGSGNLAEAAVSRATLARLAPKPTATTAKAASVQASVPAYPQHGEVVPKSRLDKVLGETLGNIEMLEATYRATPVLFELHRDAYDALKDACRRLITLLEPPAPAVPVAPCAPVPQREAGTLMMGTWRMVKKLQPCTNAQVAKALDAKPKHVHRALQSLVKQGKARKEGLTYSVVEAPTGKAIADGVVV